MASSLELVTLARGLAQAEITSYFKRMPPELEELALAFMAAVKTLESNADREARVARRAKELLEVIAPRDRAVTKALTRLDGGGGRRAVANDLAALNPQLDRLRGRLPAEAC
ncbi:MAG: hypothetical protein CSA65_07595 [Proteobacteria bacterium]|nr:MAG: hypothetical protein CSB49_01610 [Pseudomonadota bacterium]PIE17756.1 MAG: hypothetical protein CSA65_07595 [Pseudomonadota bacterium]